MKDNIEIPCKNCVLIAMCRHKKFEKMHRECKLIINTLYFDETTAGGARSKFFNTKITLIRDILKPKEWCIIKDDTGFIHVVDRKPGEYKISVDSILVDNEGN